MRSSLPTPSCAFEPDDSITLVMPQVEMGQGTYTSMSMLVAEELEIDLGKVSLEAAPPSDKLYANPLLGFQVTGGSTSVPGFWEPLRRAGATARVMLIQAAAAQWNVDPASCRAEKGEVVSPTGQRLNYGALADAAAKLPVPDKVALKDPKDFTLIGTPAKRLDTPEKVNGKAKFGIDAMIPGMKFATVAACPFLAASSRVSTTARPWRSRACGKWCKIDNAVAVVGDHMWAAMQGLAALDIEWDDGPNANVTTESIVEQMARASQNDGVAARSDGDFAKAMPGVAKKNRCRLRDAVPRARRHGANELHGARHQGQLRYLGRNPSREPGAGHGRASHRPPARKDPSAQSSAWRRLWTPARRRRHYPGRRDREAGRWASEDQSGAAKKTSSTTSIDPTTTTGSPPASMRKTNWSLTITASRPLRSWRVGRPLPS